MNILLFSTVSIPDVASSGRQWVASTRVRGSGGLSAHHHPPMSQVSVAARTLDTGCSITMVIRHRVAIIGGYIPCWRCPQTCPNLSPRRASKDGKFEDASNMEYALL